ncbi:hypothetical protein HIO71_09630 [Chryseobacterium aquaticum]|uniref:Uncharacterized protein n=1 Tax=Chryseobacterium aquaticum TaxID=452084 RepID=A0A848N6B9_9FLAO|nr:MULTISPECIES: hypothetical protein [Chryseobacterium]NMR34465.1 hypothetical protein [Chryseobacterium aquaticum]NRQ46550.1 hypothetical protein [Chryseobacterium sp. C-204]
MSRLYLFFTLLFQFCFLYGQQPLDYDKILKIENLKFNNNEIRVYKKYSTSTGLELFRFYQDENNHWKAEFYQTYSRGNQKEFKVNIRKSKLNSLKNLELLWMQILDTDVMYLPKMDKIQYKLNKKNKDYQIEDGEILSSISRTYMVDGVDYYTLIKNKTHQNEFEYENPESYLQKYPNVDELISFQELLNLIITEFKIFTNK